MTLEPVLFSLKVYGIVIVISFLCAVVIRAIVWTLSTLSERAQARVDAVDVSADGDIDGEVSADAGSDIPPEHVAAIAAAVHCLSETAAVVHIQDRRTKVAWMAQGRMAHHTSHNTVRR